jgi:hypothetical protein
MYNRQNVTNAQQWLDQQYMIVGNKEATSPLTWTRLIQHAEASGTVVLTAEQASQTVEGWSLNTIQPDVAQQVPSNFSGSNQYVQFRIQSGTYGFIKDLNLVWTLSETSGTDAVTIPPLPFLVDRVEFWGNGASNDKLQTLYPMTMFFYLMSFFSEQQLRRFSGIMNFGNYFNGLFQTPIPVSSTRRFIWPLFGNLIDQNKGFLASAVDPDLYVRVYLQTNPIAYTGVGGTGALGLTKLELQVQLQDLSSYDMKMLQESYHDRREFNFLDTLKTSDVGRVYAAGTASKFKMESVLGWVSYILLGIQPAGQQTTFTANGMLQAKDIGSTYDGAAISIENQGGQIISGITPWQMDYIRSIWSAGQFPGCFTHMGPGRGYRWMVIPFGDIPAAERDVIRKGCFTFDGFQWMNITPANSVVAETQEVYTIIPVNSGTSAGLAATGGTWTISWNGKTSAPLSYVATTVLLQQQLNYLFSDSIGFDGTPIVATAGGNNSTMANTAGCTVTLRNLPVVPSANGLSILADANCLNNGTIGVNPQVTVTTPGVVQKGFTGTMDANMYVRYFRHVHIDNGKWVIKGLYHDS